MSDTVRFKRYLHSNKEENHDIEEFFNNSDLRYLAYEEELVYEYDKKTKKHKLIGVNGKMLSDQPIDPETITEIPEP